MEERPCVFCGIISKSTPSKIVFEDDDTLAFLDIAPRSRGMTIVAPKQHYRNFDENFDLSQKVFADSLVVSEMIKQSLEPSSISISVISSEEVPHFHVRLYPVFEGEQIPLAENRPIETNEAELDDIAQKIRGIKIEIKREEPKEKKAEEKPEEKKAEGRTREDVYWMKRGMEIG
ncbi:MAG TPA: HIT domain-containing protein [archaeon]|nr:HIT domain-containing protein [archaeon]